MKTLVPGLGNPVVSDDRIPLIGVEAEDVLNISEECTPARLRLMPASGLSPDLNSAES
jgi:hypothetical protein